VVTRGSDTSSTDTYFAPDVGGTLMAEDLNGDWYDYVWLNGRVVEVISNGGVYSLHDDQTGRPEVMTAPGSNTIAWKVHPLPFTSTAMTNVWGPFNLGFPGQYFDEEDGLYYNGARDYSPGLGRYIESDPIGLVGGINTYVYVSNNPISNVDPLGLCCSKSQEEAAQGAAQLNTLSDDAGKLSIGAGALAVGAAALEIPTAGADTPVTIALGGTSAGLGTLSTGAAIGAGVLNTYASGGDPRYLESAALSALDSRIGGAMVRSLPVVGVAADLVSSYLEAKGISYSMPEPPCVNQ